MNRTLTQEGLKPQRLGSLIWIVCLCTPILFGQTGTTPSRDSSNDMILADLPKTEAARNVWRDRTSATQQTSKDAQSKKKLNDTLNRLKSMRFSDLQANTETVNKEPNQAPVPKTQEPATNKTVIIIKAPEPKASNDPNLVAAPADSSLSKQTMKSLAILALSPEKLLKPEALAQILFQGKAFPEAALCYQESLNRLNKKSTAPSEDKAWMLFQIGNCFQQSDPEQTMKLYRQLISEYPHSIWSELVRVKGQWLTWELRDKPKDLITEIKAQTEKKPKRIALN